MPKMKSNRAAMKRFKVTGSGRVKRDHAYTGHCKLAKTQIQKRRLREGTLVSTVDQRRVKRMILA